MTGSALELAVGDAKPVSPVQLDGLAAAHGVVLEADIVERGAIALLWGGAELNTLAAAALDDPSLSSDTLIAEENEPRLVEFCEACLGGSAVNLEKAFSQTVQFRDIGLASVRKDTGEQLAKLLGKPIAVEFTASGPTIGKVPGVLLFSERLETITAATVGSGTNREDQLADADTNDVAAGPATPNEVDRGRLSAKLPEGPNLDVILDIQLEVTARLGHVEMPIQDILNLGPGSIIEVGHAVDEPVELLVNDKLIARGDIVVVDEKFGLRITEIVSPRERIESLR
jgi:flagellar motor switch protein FliN